jgi:hypothetical protein
MVSSERDGFVRMERAMSQDRGIERKMDEALGDPDELVGPGDERRQAAEAERTVEGDSESERLSKAAREVAEGDPQESI